jgi:hypothetical protein
MDAAVTPLPTEETTPPVQKRYLVTLTSLSGFREIGDCHPVAQQCRLWRNTVTMPLLF